MYERLCKKCGETKPLETAFYKNYNGPGGYLSSCKKCTLAAQDAYQKTDAGRAKQARAHKKYTQTEHGKQKVRENVANWLKSENGRAYIQSRKEAPVQTEGTRECSKCSQEKDIAEFHKSLGGKGNRAAHCKDCHYKQAKKYRKTPAGKAARQKENLSRDYSKELIHVHNRQARQANAPGRGVTHEDWLERLELFGEKCYYCGDTPQLITRDHVEPLLKGGPHEPENLVPACKSCNSAKGPRFLLEWVMSDTERFI